MATQAITLADPATGNSTVLFPRDGIAYQGYDFQGTVREVKETRQAGHGAVDHTMFYDDGSFALALNYWRGSRDLIGEVGWYCHPARRPVITIVDDEWDQPRQVPLRFASAPKPITTGIGRTRPVVYTWAAPGGVWEAAGQVAVSMLAQASGQATGGLTLTSTGLLVTSTGVAVAPGQAGVEVTTFHLGDVESDWTGLLWGDSTGPAIYNDSTGQAVVFKSSLHLISGSYALINSADHSAVLNGDPSLDLAGYVDWVATDWFTIQPGANQLRYVPAAVTGPPGQALIYYRPRWAP